MEMASDDKKVIVTGEDPREEAGQMLIRLLSIELSARYPEDGADGNSDYDPETALEQSGSAFVVAWVDGKPVGCGALRPFDTESIEIKRMFVVEELRGRGIAKQILAKLEEIAIENGFRTIRLETGVRQPESNALYGKAGYVQIPCWGKYADCPLSICYEKRLVEAAGHSDRA